MSELMRRIVQASSHVEPTWSAEREARVRAGVGRGVRRRQRRGAIVIAGLGAGALVIGFVIGRQPGTAPRMALPDTSVQSVPQANLLQLPDGSSVQAGSPDARVETVEVGPTGVTLRLDSGTARFTVTPNAKRPFRVMARDVTVSVLGTVFSVGLEARAVRVGVERGRVRVDAAEGARELGVGETAAFESVAKAAAPERDPAAETATTPVPLTDLSAMPSSEPAPRAAGQGGPSWRVLAKDQNYVTALARLMAEGPNAVHDTPEDLLLAADVARLGGRPDRAVSPLQRVIADHPFDPRAPLAAFTLGRTLLEQLGRPREAARAFATARRLDRGGTLTQDALAREVESWAGAGEAEQARERALEYTRLHPRGRRLAAVRRLGGLD